MNSKLSFKYHYFLLSILCWQRVEFVKCHLYSGHIFHQTIGLVETILKISKNSNTTLDGESRYEVIEQLYSWSTNHLPILDEIYTRIEEQSTMGRKIRRIFERIGIIQTTYKLFIEHFRDPEKFSPEQRKKFVDEITYPYTNFKNASDYVFFEFSSLSRATLAKITRNTSGEHENCGRKNSSQQLLYEFYEAASLADAKATIITFYAYDMKEKLNNSTYNNLKDSEKVNLWQRLEQMADITRDEISQASREISTCPIYDLKDALKVQVFQKYLVHQSDMANMWRATFDSCQDFKRERSRCDSVSCVELPEHKKCRGEIRNCEHIQDRVDVCFSSQQSHRRYDRIKTRSGKVYGLEPAYCEKIRTFDYGFFSKFCFCDCEHDQMELDRHFSLMNSVADIDDNKIVTGARLVKRNHVFHIQIQQGVLDANGKIKGSSEWKEVDVITSSSSNFSDNVYTVTHDQNTIQLGEVEARRGEVLTGLRFARIGNDMSLQIQTTPFDSYTGKLKMAGTSWYPLTKLRGSGDSVIHFNKIDSSQSNLVSSSVMTVQFRTSNMQEDLGQNTIPLLDAQPLYLERPLPLSGAGFQLKPDNAEEVLSLKLISYDLTALM
ncbi:hypothetical protein QAD02_005955 [Eretmocerus hayati]|uniref:Uncharacterized protein n=1 Tax=Eretmocerus hayati TaxID=131215 RepID=A0ACC2N0N1_9HYME|nr:hypothetical protein QAD02_005955 [Eretmocerus hayati]